VKTERSRALEQGSAMETLSDEAVASFPGSVKLSRKKLSKLQPEFDSLPAWILFLIRTQQPVSFDRSYWLKHIEEHLWYGDSRAAIVVSVAPLLVAAYTDELDAVAILRFTDELVEQYDLKVSSRLLSVNIYYSSLDSASDLIIGPGAAGRWANFSPLIAEFLSDDSERMNERKDQISEQEWQRTEELASDKLENDKHVRDGRPMLCSRPAKVERQPKVKTLDIYKSGMVFFGLLAFTVLSFVAASRQPDISWLGVALFGTMSTLAGWHTIKLCRSKTIERTSANRYTRDSLIWIGSLAVTLLFGLAGEWFADVISGPRPSVAIWVATFVSTLAFYPFRGDQKRDFPNLRSWAIYCAVMGSVSVGISMLTGDA